MHVGPVPARGPYFRLGMDIDFFTVATNLYMCQSIISSRTYSCFGSLPWPKALAARLLAMESCRSMIFM